MGKWSFVRNWNLRTKLFSVLGVVFIAMIVSTYIAVNAMNTLYSDLSRSLHDESLTSVSHILNADRDMYQAQLALQMLVTAGYSDAWADS